MFQIGFRTGAFNSSDWSFKQCLTWAQQNDFHLIEWVKAQKRTVGEPLNERSGGRQRLSEDASAGGCPTISVYWPVPYGVDYGCVRHVTPHSST